MQCINENKDLIKIIIAEEKDAGHTKEQAITRVYPFKQAIREEQDIINGMADRATLFQYEVLEDAIKFEVENYWPDLEEEQLIDALDQLSLEQKDPQGGKED